MSEVSAKGGKRNVVFLVSAAIVIVISVWGAILGDSFADSAAAVMGFLEENFSWVYVFGMTGLVIFSIVLAISKFGKITLGKPGEKPFCGKVAWFAMMFTAGMGVGLVFWGVAEPLTHYISPIDGIEPLSEESERFAIRSSFLHWGLHPWACFAPVGIVFAYYQYRRNKKAQVSTMLEPLLGKTSKGAVGKAIDIYVVVLSAVGIAVSFGLGCLQLSGGLDYMFNIPPSVLEWLIIIACVGAVYCWSSTSGLTKGMQKISTANLIICIVLSLSVLILGPTVEIFNTLFTGIGDYITNLVQDSIRLHAENGDASWVNAWTVFYWAWWISWAPFVGIFLARVSRGRSIRSFVVGSVLLPTAFGMIWFSINGTVAIDAVTQAGLSLEQLTELASSSETALFFAYSSLPLGTVLSIVAMVLLFLFFITSADSASYVLGMLSAEGDLNPPKHYKLFWGILMAVIAFVLLLAGGLKTIQNVAIAVSFPFFFIMILLCVSLVRSLIEETKHPEVIEYAEHVDEIQDSEVPKAPMSC